MPLIVIVDDRLTNRNIFAKLAAAIEEGIEVKTFGDPAEALVWLQDHTPDLVITDFKMPQMDGAEFIRRFRAQSTCIDIPVVVITVYEERSFRLRALESGATDFLNSPVDHHEFVTRARNLLNLRKHQLLLADRADSLERRLEHSERSRERAMRDSFERLTQVIDTLPVLISAAAPDGRLLFANAGATTYFGVTQPQVIGKPVTVLFGEEAGARSQSLDGMVFQTGKPLPSFEEEIADSAGARHVFLTVKSPLRDNAGAVSAVLTSSLDITARKKTEANLRYMAHHDSLTHLPNRSLLRERMRRLALRTKRGEAGFALHLLDLDGFKGVNDLHGHSAGDRFLRTVAEKLRSEMRESDTIARLGGDEFAVLQAEADQDSAAQFSRRLLAVIADCTDNANAPVTASIGVALHPADGNDAEELLKNADMAMYRAKADGGNAYCFYVAEMQAQARNSAQLDKELRRALVEHEFELFYQPQVDLASGAIVGAEALIRWRRPGFGIVGPHVFLPHAEENGLIHPINEWVLREACREARRWDSVGLPPLRIGVNLSPLQFRKRTVPLQVAQALAESGLSPGRLDLELTESIVLQDIDAVATDLRSLLDLGVHVSIDDFGTGYSSLNYIKKLPVDRIKIDMSFVRNICTEPSDAAIVRAIITLGHSLDMKVVAEGVETPEQLARMQAEGCDEVQGYYFGKPMPADDFIALVARQSREALSA
jgi:diguanylate cyclase (GGDEF)-like protein/PAS domain S-box-containing protein